MRKSDYKTLTLILAVIIGLIAVFRAVDDNIHLNNLGSRDSTAANYRKSPRYFSDYKTVEPELQYFDPNTADSTTLLSLGLPAYIVRSIYKYRYMGGVYSTAEDFARIPGLTQKQYRLLKPYIKIS